MNMEEGMYENIMENTHELVGLAIQVYCMFTFIMFEVYGSDKWMNEGYLLDMRDIKCLSVMHGH